MIVNREPMPVVADTLGVSLPTGGMRRCCRVGMSPYAALSLCPLPGVSLPALALEWATVLSQDSSGEPLSAPSWLPALRSLVPGPWRFFGFGLRRRRKPAGEPSPCGRRLQLGPFPLARALFLAGISFGKCCQTPLLLLEWRLLLNRNELLVSSPLTWGNGGILSC